MTQLSKIKRLIMRINLQNFREIILTKQLCNKIAANLLKRIIKPEGQKRLNHLAYQASTDLKE